MDERELRKQEEWEEKEHQQKDEYFGDQDKRINKAVTTFDMLHSIQKRNLEIIKTKGIGHSKKPKKPNWDG